MKQRNIKMKSGRGKQRKAVEVGVVIENKSRRKRGK